MWRAKGKSDRLIAPAGFIAEAPEVMFGDGRGTAGATVSEISKAVLDRFLDAYLALDEEQTEEFLALMRAGDMRCVEILKTRESRT